MFVEKFVGPFKAEFLEMYHEYDSTGFRALFDASKSMRWRDLEKIALEDGTYGVLSMSFVLFYFAFNMGSLFLAMAGASIIAFSFPVTLAIG